MSLRDNLEQEKPFEQSEINNEQSSKTELHKRIREGERKAAFFLSNKRFIELSTSLESLEQLLKQYYKLTPILSKDTDFVRSLNRLKKRQQLIIIHNRSVSSYLSQNYQQSVDSMTLIVEQIGNMIQGEQVRLGFLEEDQQTQRQKSHLIINFWKQYLIRYYYFLAQITYKNGIRQISIAALMKGFDLIKQSFAQEAGIAKNRLYDDAKSHNKSYSARLSDFQQAEQLYLMCELKDKVSFSKYLNNVTVNHLLQIISSLLLASNLNSKQSTCIQFFKFDKLIDLELISMQSIVRQQNKLLSFANQLQFSLTAKFLYLDLLGKIEREQNREIENQYTRLKSVKNLLFIHIILLYICSRYAPYCQQFVKIIEIYHQIYKGSTVTNQHPVSLYYLIDAFGLTPEQLTKKEKNFDTISIVKNNNFSKTKELKTKKVRVKSKQTTKSKPKISQGKSKCKEPKSNKLITQQKMTTKRQKLKQQYMPKKDPKKLKIKQDHLTKAINKNYLTFEASNSKQKVHSNRRVIRTETCINNIKENNLQETIVHYSNKIHAHSKKNF